MNDKARWDTPELERIGHAADVRSGSDTNDVIEQLGSNPSGPT